MTDQLEIYPNPKTMSEGEILREAEAIYGRRIIDTDVLQTPDDVAGFLHAKLTDRDREIFSVIFLNTHHHVIDYEEMFLGTIDGAVVAPP